MEQSKKLNHLKTLLENCLKQIEEIQNAEKEVEKDLTDAELAEAILKSLKDFKYTGTAKYMWIQKKYLDFRGNPDRKTGEPIKKYYITKDRLTISVCDDNQKVIGTCEPKIWKLNNFKRALKKRGLNVKDEEWYPFIITLKMD